MKNELNTIHHRQLKKSLIRKHIIGWGLGSLIVGVGIYFMVKEPVDADLTVNEILTTSIDSAKSKSRTESEDNKIVVSQQIKAHNTITNNNQQNVVPDKNITTDINREFKGDSIPVTLNADSLLANSGKENQKDNSGLGNVGQGKMKQVDCRKVRIYASLSASESLIEKPSGRIYIDAKTLTGGTPPHKFALSKSNFSDSLSFSNLHPGSYTVYARDANNCVVKIGSIEVEQKHNSNQQVFAPLKGEIWVVPLKGNISGTLKIFTKTGLNVYTAKFIGGEDVSWNGASLSGNQLPMGFYPFEIIYSDGTIFRGSVTIVR